MNWKIVRTLVFTAALVAAGPALASTTKGSHGAHDEKQAAMTGTFAHNAVVEGLKTEFQIMSLESMNMKDPDGATHHVMLKVFDQADGTQVSKLAGKVKVIAPSGKEQVASLKDYSGTYAANFSVDEKGKYGVICLFKANGSKHVVKFWYPRH